MPEVPQVMISQPDEVVRSFYRAVNARDADVMGAVLEDLFDEDAAVEFPPSLPYGGRTQGARRLRKMFLAMATSAAGAGPRTVQVEDVIATTDRV